MSSVCRCAAPHLAGACPKYRTMGQGDLRNRLSVLLAGKVKHLDEVVDEIIKEVEA